MLKLKVEELNKELKKCQYSTKGNKKDLQQRLEAVIIKGDPLVEYMTRTWNDNFYGWCDGEYLDKSRIEGFNEPTVPSGDNHTTKKG